MVECNLAKVDVEGSNPFSRSKRRSSQAGVSAFGLEGPWPKDPVTRLQADDDAHAAYAGRVGVLSAFVIAAPRAKAS